MPEKHLSTQFDSELSSISTRVMELGGLVESQIRQAIYALSQFSVEVANEVSAAEVRVNAMEIEIDRELSNIIARRQPTAVDLRLLIAISKATANLERVGDEADFLQYLEGAIDGGQVHAGGRALHLDENLVGGTVPQVLDRLEDELTLRRDAEAVLAQPALPVLRHGPTHLLLAGLGAAS